MDNNIPKGMPCINYENKLHTFSHTVPDEELEDAKNGKMTAGLKYKVKDMCALVGTLAPNTKMYYLDKDGNKIVFMRADDYPIFQFLFITEKITLIADDEQPQLSIYGIRKTEGDLI